MENITLTKWQISTINQILAWIEDRSNPELDELYHLCVNNCGIIPATLSYRVLTINPGRRAGKTVMCEALHQLLLPEYNNVFLIKHNRHALRAYIQRFNSRAEGERFTSTPGHFLQRVRHLVGYVPMPDPLRGLDNMQLITESIFNQEKPIIIMDEPGIVTGYKQFITDLHEGTPGYLNAKDPLFIVLGEN